MSGGTRCLKSLFIGVNILLVIAGGLTCTLAVLLNYIGSSGQNRNSEPAMAAVNTQLILRAAGMFAVAAFGFYGVCKDKKWPLIVYITAYVIGVVIFLVEGTAMAIARAMISSFDTDGQRSPFLQGVLMAADCMLAISFVPASLGIIGIILAAVIIHKLRRQTLVEGQMSNVEGQLPEYSELYPVTK